MFDRLVIGSVALSLGSVTPDAASFRRCVVASAKQGPCAWRHGRFIVVSGAHSSRIGFFGGTPAGIAVHQPGEKAPDEWMPRAVAKILWSSPLSRAVDGTYLVCPLHQPATDWYSRDQRPVVACLAGARQLIARRRVGY